MQFLIILGTVVCGTFAFRQQTIGVKGQLVCGDVPLVGARVKVWNKNKIGTDDQLIDVKTDAMGHFSGVGGVGSLFALDPHLKIYHTCDRQFSLIDIRKPCSRKVDLGLPSSAVTRSNKVEEYFDIGRMNMQLIFPSEETKCFV